MQRLRDIKQATSPAASSEGPDPCACARLGPRAPEADPLSLGASLRARGALGREEAEILAEREREVGDDSRQFVSFQTMNGVMYREVIDGFLIREW